MDQFIPPDPVERLREVLQATVADIPKLEAAVTAAQATVTAAQERLRRQMAAAQKIRDALGLLEADEATPTATQLPLPESVPPDSPFASVVGMRYRRPPLVMPEVSGLETKKARITRAVTELLRMRGAVHRKVILDNLIEAGIMGRESDPLAHLAAFLSNENDKFASDGKGNFTLKPAATQPQPAKMSDAGDMGVGDTGHTSAHP